MKSVFFITIIINIVLLFNLVLIVNGAITDGSYGHRINELRRDISWPLDGKDLAADGESSDDGHKDGQATFNEDNYFLKHDPKMMASHGYMDKDGWLSAMIVSKKVPSWTPVEHIQKVLYIRQPIEVIKKPVVMLEKSFIIKNQKPQLIRKILVGGHGGGHEYNVDNGKSDNGQVGVNKGQVGVGTGLGVGATGDLIGGKEARENDAKDAKDDGRKEARKEDEEKVVKKDDREEGRENKENEGGKGEKEEEGVFGGYRIGGSKVN